MRTVALCEQPEDLPPRLLVGLFGTAIAALEFVDAQMQLEMDMSAHVQILPPPTCIPYEKPSENPFRSERVDGA